MKSTKKILALVLGVVLCLSVFAGCKNNKVTQNTTTPLVVGYSPFSSKFSPFFAETAYDQDAQGMTQVGLLTSDRTGAIIYNGIKGETVKYNGKDYTYYGIADLKVTENQDGTVDYDFTLRDDVKFSDGEPLTVDDVIFNMYVLSDPTYDGNSTFFALPIKGMKEYRSGMDTLFNLLVKAGKDNTDYTNWTAEEQTAFWADLEQAGAKFAQEIVDYCADAGYAASKTDVAGGAAAWGFDGLAADATAADFFALMCEEYAWDLASLSSTETAGSSLFDLMNDYSKYTKGIKTGDSAAKIEGITKTGKNTLRVSLTEVDATAIYQLGVTVAPMHYYGSKDLYDYDNNKFGFVKGDLSSVRAKTTQPMGAGPYKFNKFENGVIYFEANDSYYLGMPHTKYVNFLETQDKDKLNGVTTGTIDITDPSFSGTTVDAIKAANGGELNGSKITVNTVNNLGYGYVGISAKAVNINGEVGSDASKNLRKGFATILAAFRDVSVKSYYGERASVINYPISDTSWAAPQATDEGYKIAFSVDADGKAIYTSDMNADAKIAAAKAAALGFFAKAGATVADGKVTALPAGISKEAFVLQIPGDGSGDHPAFMMVTEAAKVFQEIGIDFTVKDLTNSSDLWTAIEADQCDMWAAAWGATVDPDMYQIYYSDVANGGKNPGGSNYEYDIADPELDKLIMDARKSLEQSYRKTIYKQCLDIIVDWAVEIPVYQRQNAIIFSTERVKLDTVTPDITTFYGWMAEIQNIEVVEKAQ